MSETAEPSDIVERLAVVAQKLREHEEPLRIAGDPSGLGIGAAAILVEMAGQEITRLRAALAEHDDPVTYKGMNDWLDELENFSLRRERVPDGAMPWIETAWRLATLAEREWCARVADERHRAALKRMEAAVTEDGGTIFDMEQATAAYIAAAIRSRGS